MREIILIFVIIGLTVAGLFRPEIGICAYVWFGLMRPDILAWSYGHHQYSAFLAVTTALGSARYLSRLAPLLGNPIFIPGLLLQVPILLSCVFAYDPSLTTQPFSLYLRMVLTAALIPLLIQTESWLRKMFLVMSVSLGVLGSKFGIFGVIHGGVRFVQGYGGFLSDNNQIALALACAIPLCWYSRELVAARWAKALFVFMAFNTIIAVVMTHSRGGALALGVVLLLMAARSKYKILAAVVLLAVTAVAVFMVRDSFLDRMATLKMPSAEGSAVARMRLAKASIAMWIDHPILGVGFGTLNQMALLERYTGPLPGNPEVAHNTFLQMLVDSGIFAFLIYTAWLLGTIWWLGRSLRRFRRSLPHSPLAAIPAGIQISLIGFSVGSFFLSRVQFDLGYFLLMSAASWYIVEPAIVKEAAEPPAAPAPGILPNRFALPRMPQGKRAYLR